MKTTLLTLTAIALTLSVMAQTKQDTLVNNNFTTTLLATSITIQKDTVVCYFREITGIVKGNLMGRWVKGYMIKPKGQNSWMYDSNNPIIYLYSDKKTKVTNKVIQYY